MAPAGVATHDHVGVIVGASACLAGDQLIDVARALVTGVVVRVKKDSDPFRLEVCEEVWKAGVEADEDSTLD